MSPASDSSVADVCAGGCPERERVRAAVSALAVLLIAVVSLLGVTPAWASRGSSSAGAHASTGQLTLRGREANNTFVIRATGVDRGSYSVDGGPLTRFSGIRSLTMDGVGGHDVCRIVNPRHGLFAPPDGISCNGGNAPGRPRRGVLELVGGRATGGSYAPGRPGAGTITHRLGNMSQVIRFTGMAPVTDTVPESGETLILDADDTVELVNGPSPGTLTVQSSNGSFEMITFSNKTDVSIDANGMGEQGQLDTTQSATGLSSLTFTANGNITNEQAALTGVNVTLDSVQGLLAQASGGPLAASSVLLSAIGGIGSASQPFQLSGPVDLAFANGTGAVDITCAGALTIASVGGLSASSNHGTTTTLAASSPLTFAANTTSAGTLTATTSETPNETTTPLPSPDDDLTVNSGVTVESTGGDVNLTAADGLVLQSGSVVKSDTGNVSLAAGVGDTDNDSFWSLQGMIEAPNGTITPAPPSASITTPPFGAVYPPGAVVKSAFKCSEGTGGPGIASCVDQNGNPSGTAIDTSTVGLHALNVTATSKDGFTGTANVTYRVASPPTASITTPANGATYAQGQVVASSFSCSDMAGGTGIASCVDQNGRPSGQPIDTSTTGTHTFTVTATSRDGLTGSASVTYTVSPAGCQDAAGAYNQGFNAGFNSGFNAGFNSGFNAGFHAGFQSGFGDGFGSAARHGSVASSRFSATVSGRAQAIAAQALPPACDQLFNQGFNTAFNVGFNSGFQRGFASGFASGFNAGFNDGYSDRHRR